MHDVDVAAAKGKEQGPDTMRGFYVVVAASVAIATALQAIQQHLNVPDGVPLRVQHVG